MKKENKNAFLLCCVPLQPQDTEKCNMHPILQYAYFHPPQFLWESLREQHHLISHSCGFLGLVPTQNVLSHRDISELGGPTSELVGLPGSLAYHSTISILETQSSQACAPSGLKESHIAKIAIAAYENQS